MMSENSRMTISAGTIARTLCLCLALANQILTATGHSIIDVSNDDINTLISTGFTVVSAVVAWWKNNSFTQSALKADEVMKEERANAGSESN